MGKLTVNELSDSLKELVDDKQDKIDNSLETNDKTIVGAINELFQSANNGKELIASVIGEPVSADDTFQAMSNDINGLLNTFKTNMINSGVAVESGDKFKQLIDKIKGLTEGEGNKGVQFAEGSGEWETKYVSNDYTITIPTNLDFMPTYIFCFGDFSFDDNIYEGEEYVNNMLVSNIAVAKGKYSGATVGIIDITPESFTVDGYYKYNIGHNAARTGKAVIKRWFAIGVGEEENTSTGLNIISATELPATGKEGQICVVNSIATDNISLTPNYSDIKSDNTNIICITGVKNLSKDVLMTLNNINYTMSISRFFYQGKAIPSYIYQNDTWKEFTNTKAYLFKTDYIDDPALPPMGDLDETHVGDYTHLALLTNDDGTKYMYLQPCQSNFGMDYYRIICSAEKIDFSKYSTVEIELKFVYSSSSNTNDMSFGYGVGYSDTFVSRDYDRPYQYGTAVSNSEYISLKPNVYKTITADISNQSGEYYILFSFGITSFGVYINSICLY